jgi:hypothetical protein
MSTKSTKELQEKLVEMETKLEEKSRTNKKLFAALQQSHQQLGLTKKKLSKASIDPHDQEVFREMKKEIKRLKSMIIRKQDLQFISAAVRLATQKIQFLAHSVSLAKHCR